MVNSEYREGSKWQYRRRSGPTPDFVGREKKKSRKRQFINFGKPQIFGLSTILEHMLSHKIPV